MAALADLAVLLCGLESVEEARARVYNIRAALIESWPSTLRPPALLWLLSSSPPGYLQLAPERVLHLGLPDRARRFELWLEAAGTALPESQLRELAGRFLLSEGQLRRAARKARAALDAEPVRTARGCFEAYGLAARQEANTGLGALAQPESASVSLDALVLSEESASLLEELLGYIEHREALATGLGFAEALGYGLGVTALFTGPPGTGKSYAAKAIAHALQLELYRVDLSQLVSKYIGETEKHLSQLFDAARGGEVILLFDEADAIFAKRTEVRTSVDRYANLEVGYLLQRIESFDGLVILTTNHEASIDEAFQRRIRFRIPFDAPDVAARLRLWEGLLPTGLRRAADVDVHYLAEVYELSGGHLKEVVLRASALALRAAGSGAGAVERAVLTQSQLLRAADAEYRKLGKLPPIRPRAGGGQVVEPYEHSERIV
jgi:hypothetical protein